MVSQAAGPGVVESVEMKDSLLNVKAAALTFAFLVFKSNFVLADMHVVGDPLPPRTPLDDWNDMIGTFVNLGLLAVAVCAIAWLIFWGFRKMRFARLQKNR